MKQRNIKQRALRVAAIAAVYVVLCLLFQNLSYGPVQIRVSEALTMLVVLCPEAVLGVTLGCLVSNALSFSMVDMIIGTLATFVAALLSRELKDNRLFKTAKNPGFALAASIPPVVLNAMAVGLEIGLFFSPEISFISLGVIMLQVGLGQVVCCSILGVMLVWVIERNPRLLRLLQDPEDDRR